MCQLSFTSRAQDTSTTITKQRILIILNSSISMEQSWHGDTTKFEAAAMLVERLMDSVYKIDDELEFGLHVYGHQFPAGQSNCLDSRREVWFSRDNRAQIALRMASLKNQGVSPVAYSIKQAMEQEMEKAEKMRYFFILITDGDENCSGDICESVQEYYKRNIDYRSATICMVDYQSAKLYVCMGDYLIAARKADIPIVIGGIQSRILPNNIKRARLAKLKAAHAID
jgi:Ca-activated chloride channel family protein